MTQSPSPSALGCAPPGARLALRPPSAVSIPSELAGLEPPRPIADAKLGVPGRPNVGEETRLPLPFEYMVEAGLASLEGERPPPGGRGELERGGAPEPVNFFWIRVREKMACDRDDWAFMSVSLVRRMEVPWRMRLHCCQLTTPRIEE